MKITLIFRRLDFLVASGCTVLCSLAMFVYNLYVKTYVMPYEFGIYTTASLALTYMGYLQLGVLNAYNRDYPRLLGGGEADEAEKLRRNVFSYIAVIYAGAAVLGAMGSLLLTRLGTVDRLLGIGFAINAVYAGLTVLYSFFDTSAKSEGRVITASLVALLRTAVLVAAGWFAVRAWGYWGLFAAVSVSALCPFIFFVRRIRSLRFSLDRGLIWELMKTGAPLLVSALIWTVTMSVDKFVILTFMSVTELGIYSTAMLGFSTLVLIPSSISQIFYIRMSKKYGETGRVEDLLQAADKFTYYVSLCTSLVTVLAYFGLPIIIRSYITGYIGGIASAQILILGVSLYSTTMMYSNVFSVLKLNAKLLRNNAALCVLNALLSTAFVLMWGRRIECVAYGTSVSYALYSILLILVLGRTLKIPIIKTLLNSWLPILCVAVPCVVLSMLVRSEVVGFAAAAGVAGVMLGAAHWLRHHKLRQLFRRKQER